MRKKILLAVGILAIGSLGSLALTTGHSHKHHDPEKMVQKKVAYLTEQLSLTEDQQKQVEEISSKFAKMMKEAKSDGKPREEMMSLMKDNMQKVHAEIKAILTDEQVAKFENLDFHHMHHGDHHTHAKMREIHDELKPTLTSKRAEFEAQLTDAEKATISEVRKVTPSMDEIHSKMKECHKECRREHKKHGQQHDTEGMKAHHKEMKKKFHEKHAGLIKATAPLNAIVENHESELQVIFKEMKEKAMERFEGDISEPVKMMMEEHKKEHFEMMAKHFLLMETEAPAIETLAITAFPNPAIDVATISYELKEAQTVKVSILNSEGTLLKEIFSGNQEKGMNQVKVELNNLRTSDFFIVKVESGTKTGTQKILLKK